MSEDRNNEEYEVLSLLHKGLIDKGRDFPNTVGEVEEIERYFSENPITVPKKLKNPLNAFNKTRTAIDNSINFPRIRNEETFHQFAQAAREGGEISDSIKEKMKRDRELAEKGSDEK